MAETGLPSIGIVVPVLNEARMLPALLALLPQLGADELLLVDGGSIDDSDALLQASGLPWMTAHAGRASQMNAAAARIDSDVILFLHADTGVTAAHLEDIRRCMRDEAYVGGRFDVQLSGTHPLLPLVAWLMNLRSRLTRISTGDQAMFARRETFRLLGGFPEQPLMEDIELARRLKRQGRICCLRRRVVTSARRWQKQGLWRTIRLMWRLRLLYWLGMDSERLAACYRSVR